MRSLNSMLDEYAQSHQNRFNQIIHKFCVPTIMFSILGLLWSIPALDSMKPNLNWAALTALFVMFYYFILSRKYFIIMIPVIGLMYLGNYFLSQTDYLLVSSIIVFVISWAFQFWGHKVEGKKPSFLKDLLFLLIGPLWVMKALFNLKD